MVLRPPVEIENKGRYQRRDIERWAKRYGLPMRFPGPFPFCTLKTMRAAMFREERRKLEALVGQAFALYWGEGGAPKGFEEADEYGSVREVARRIGADPDEVLQELRSWKRRSPENATSEAVERGIFGALTFFVGEEMFWGNDRLCFVEQALEKNGR